VRGEKNTLTRFFDRLLVPCNRFIWSQGRVEDGKLKELIAPIGIEHEKSSSVSHSLNLSAAKLSGVAGWSIHVKNWEAQIWFCKVDCK
jgi:hypothetical protein